MSILYHYQVACITPLTSTHLRLIIKPIDHFMNYEAGQYLKILYPSGNNLPFSIANAPCSTHEIELHIRLSPEDLSTQVLLQNISDTKLMTISGPFGECQYKNEPGPLIILAAGTGFAPAKAIIEKLAASNPDRECHLYWTVKKSTDFYLPELPGTWERQLRHFHYVPIQTQLKNTIKANILDAVVSNFELFKLCQVYVFGPPKLAIDVLKELIKRGLDVNNFYADVLSKQQILEWSQIA